MRKYYSAFFVFLLAATAARADGGISALGGILDMFLLMIGAGGLFIILLMFAIIGAQKDKPGTSIGTKTGIAVSVAYVFLAAFFFAASSESPFRLIPAYTGGGTIALLCVYMYRLGDKP